MNRDFVLRRFAGQSVGWRGFGMSPDEAVRIGLRGDHSLTPGQSLPDRPLTPAAVLVPLVWRPLTVRILAVLALILSLNRIAAGGHFLSDVLLAWWFTLLVMAVGWRWLYSHPLVANERLEAGLTDAGTAIRRLAVRLIPNKKDGPPPPLP